MITNHFQGRMSEWKWPVVDTREPKGVRTACGYVTIFERQTESGAPLSHHVLFSDFKGHPFQSLAVEDMDIFYDATQAALAEMGYGDGPSEHRPIIGDIIR